MKTKFFFALVAAIFSSISGMVAQTYYYNDSTTFTQNGYSYRCDQKSGARVHLYNTANIYTNTEETYINGSPLSLETRRAVFDGALNAVMDNSASASASICTAIITDVLSPYSLPSRQVLIITVAFNTTTGKAMEVEFEFLRKQCYATVPVSAYREIETRIKADPDLSLTFTSFGQQLNYVKMDYIYEL